MANSNFNQLLQSLMGGGFQGVGADAGGNTVSTGPNQYYYNPTASNLTMANYMPTGSRLDTQGVTNPWASSGAPQEYNPTGSYRANANGTYTPSWAVTPNWMPSAWGGQLPAYNQNWDC